jgi:hypothetical protein
MLILLKKLKNDYQFEDIDVIALSFAARQSKKSGFAK